MQKSVTVTFASYFNLILNPSQENVNKFMEAVKHKQIGDKHGNVHMGLADDQHFSLWKIFGANIPIIRYYFGPIIIITDFKIAKQLLKVRKNTAKDNNSTEVGHCIGNRSSYIIQSQVGKNNIFGAETSDSHIKYKTALRNALNNEYDNNISHNVKLIMSTYVKSWLNDATKEEQINIKHMVNKIVCIFFARIILGHDPNEKNLDDILKTADSFVSSVINPVKQTFSYSFWNNTVIGDAQPNMNSDNLPNKINELVPGCGNEIAIMLEKVGFSNIHSALSSIIFRLANTNNNNNMYSEVKSVDTYNYIDIANNFFFETMRLAPPVWLQARKVGPNGLKLDGLDKFPAYSLLLVPNFMLARNMRNHEFRPDLVTDEEKKLFNPFSYANSPNACAGKMIAVPLIELVMGEIVKNYIVEPVKINEEYVGDVALKFKNEMLVRIVKNIK